MKRDVNYIMDRTKEFIHRLYVVIYSEAMDLNPLNFSNSVCGSEDKLEIRKKLINSALRFNNTKIQGSTRDTTAPEELTAFKPFTLREIEFEVWETK